MQRGRIRCACKRLVDGTQHSGDSLCSVPTRRRVEQKKAEPASDRGKLPRRPSSVCLKETVGWVPT